MKALYLRCHTPLLTPWLTVLTNGALGSALQSQCVENDKKQRKQMKNGFSLYKWSVECISISTSSLPTIVNKTTLGPDLEEAVEPSVSTVREAMSKVYVIKINSNKKKAPYYLQEVVHYSHYTISANEGVVVLERVVKVEAPIGHRVEFHMLSRDAIVPKQNHCLLCVKNHIIHLC